MMGMKAVTLLLLLALLAHCATALAVEGDVNGAAPVPPEGAVKSAADVQKAAPKAAGPKPISSLHHEAHSLLDELRKPVKHSQPNLSSEWLESIQQRLDAVRDSQDAKPKPSAQSELLRLRASKLIARQIARVLTDSTRAMRRAEKGELTESDLVKMDNALNAVRESEKGSLQARKLAQGNALHNANKLLPKGKAPPKDPAPAPKHARAYEKHAENPKHHLKVLKAEKDLPQHVLDRGLMEVDAASSPAVNEQGQLCPGCQPVVLNAESPVSTHERALIAAAHSDVHVDDVKLHGQETLDRAALMVDDASKLSAKLRNQFPTDSLLQFDGHN